MRNGRGEADLGAQRRDHEGSRVPVPVQRYRGEPGHTRDTRAVQYANVSLQGLQHQWPTGAGDPLWETRRGLPPGGSRDTVPVKGLKYR